MVFSEAMKRVKRVGRPVGVVGDETRGSIVEAACKCFAERGYANTRNQDIARLAGVTTGALYHYFAGKADLFAAVHRHVQGLLVDFYRRAFAEEKTCVAQLCAGLEASVRDDQVGTHVARFASIAPVEIQRHAELGKILEADVREIRDFFRRLVEAGRERGELAPDVRVDAVINMIIAAFFGLAWLRAHLGDAEAHAEAVRAFRRLLEGELFRTRKGGPGGDAL